MTDSGIPFGDSMRLGKFEFLAMNNPLRRCIQKYVEFRTFKFHLKKRRISLEKKVIMDAGCGSGYSTELIAHEFHPSRIIAFDYMPEQINLAKKRELSVDFSTGDLTQIESADNTCDAVFIFGVLHHIPEWRTAVCEVFRVLRPGGVLLVDEPRARFNWLEFESGIRQAGMNILEVRNIFFTLLRGYLCQKPI